MHLHLQLQEVKRCFFHFCHMHIHPITFPDCSFRYSDYRIRWNAYLYYFTLIMMAMVAIGGVGLGVGYFFLSEWRCAEHWVL